MICQYLLSPAATHNYGGSPASPRKSPAKEAKIIGKGGIKKDEEDALHTEEGRTKSIAYQSGKKRGQARDTQKKPLAGVKQKLSDAFSLTG